MMSKWTYSPGSFFDDLVESYAGTHDLVGGQLPGFYDGEGNTARGRSPLADVAANTDHRSDSGCHTVCHERNGVA
jgi:filamentous hemagglutinin